MPTTLTGLLLFVVLPLPGFAYTITKERNTPAARRSPFRETVEIVSASVVAGLGAMVTFAGARGIWPEHTPDIGALVRDAETYLHTDYGLVAGWAGWLLAAATLASGIAGLIVGQRPPHASKMSSWWEMFESWYPGYQTYVGCTLDDGSYVEGIVCSYNDSADDSPDRDLILKRPNKLRLPGEEESRQYGGGAVCISARRVVAMLVTPLADRSDRGSTSAPSSASDRAASAEPPAAEAALTAAAGHVRSPGPAPAPSGESAADASAHGYDRPHQPPAQVGPRLRAAPPALGVHLYAPRLASSSNTASERDRKML